MGTPEHADVYLALLDTISQGVRRLEGKLDDQAAVVSRHDLDIALLKKADEDRTRAAAEAKVARREALERYAKLAGFVIGVAGLAAKVAGIG